MKLLNTENCFSSFLCSASNVSTQDIPNMITSFKRMKNKLWNATHKALYEVDLISEKMKELHALSHHSSTQMEDHNCVSEVRKNSELGNYETREKCVREFYFINDAGNFLWKLVSLSREPMRKIEQQVFSWYNCIGIIEEMILQQLQVFLIQNEKFTRSSCS
jgi:hypothetical protein